VVTAFPVDEPLGYAVVVLADPDLAVLALQEMPHFIEFDHHRFAGWRFAAPTIDIATHPAQHRLRRGAEQVGHGVERQAVAVQADGRTWFGRAVPVKASELVAAPLAAPPLLARDVAVPDQAATTAPGIVWKIGDHQHAKL